jgi:uncharacterized protein
MTAAHELTQFSGEKYLNIETFRKNGVGVRTPVWFAASGPIEPDRDDVVLYLYTLPDSGKMKRMRNNRRVRIGPCSMSGGLRGTWVDAEARFVEGTEAQHANRMLNRKYWPWKSLLQLAGRLRRRRYAIVALRVV